MRYISCDRKYRRSQHVPQKSKSLQPNNECLNNVINYYILLCEVLLLNIICHNDGDCGISEAITDVLTENGSSRY